MPDALVFNPAFVGRHDEVTVPVVDTPTGATSLLFLITKSIALTAGAAQVMGTIVSIAAACFSPAPTYAVDKRTVETFVALRAASAAASGGSLVAFWPLGTGGPSGR